MFIVQKSDYESLAGFLSENEPTGRTKEYWSLRFSFWWDNNPAFLENMNRGWIIRDSDGIVGFAGAIPTFFQVNGEKKIVINGTTWVVKPEFRGEQSAELFLKALKNARGTSYFDTTSSGKIAKMKILTKFKYMFTPLGIRDYLYIINLKKLLSIKLKNNFLSSVIFTLFLPINFLLKLSVNLRLHFYKEAYQIEFDNSGFDLLWEKTKKIFSNTNIRDSESLNWLLNKFPGQQRVVIGYYENKELLGYAVCLDMSETKIKKLICSDVWYDFENKSVLASLLKGCIKYGKENKFDVVVMPGFNKKIENIFRKLMVYIRSGKNYFYKFDPEEIQPLTPENTYFVYLQGDFGLF